MTLLDLVIVIVSLVGLVLLAGWLASRQHKTADYYLGGHRLSWVSLGLSLAANQVSAISLVGAPAFVALAAGGGLVWLQYELAVPLAMAILALWGVPLLRQTSSAEVYAVVEERLGIGARRLLACFFLVGRGLAAGVILYASSLVVNACTGWRVGLCLLVVGGVTLVYTALGGLVADVYSDVLQLVLLWGGTLVATMVLGFNLAEHGSLLADVDPQRLLTIDVRHHGLGDGATFAFWPMLFGGLFLYLSYYGCDQTQAQRVLAASDQAAARRSLALAAFVRFPLVLTYCCFGVMLAAFLPRHPELVARLEGLPDDALVPQFLVHYLPTGLLGVAVAGILAAALSSIDSAFNSLSAVTLEELLPSRYRSSARQELAWARLITVVWGAFAMLAAVVFSRAGATTIELVNLVGSVLYGPVLALFLLAWRSRRADSVSAILGAMTGVVANLSLAILAPSVSWLWWNPAGCLCTLVVGVLAGRATTPRAPTPRAQGIRLGLGLVGYFLLVLLLLVIGQTLLAR